MQTLEEKVGDLLIVSIRGILDTVGTPLFEAQLMQKIDAGMRSVIIDASELQYVNSAGLKSFLLAAKRLDELGGKLVVCALSPRIAAIFAAIGFDQIMATAPSRQDAVQRLAGAPRAV